MWNTICQNNTLRITGAVLKRIEASGRNTSGSETTLQWSPVLPMTDVRNVS